MISVIGVLPTAQAVLVVNRLPARKKSQSPAKIALMMLLTPANASLRLNTVDVHLAPAVAPVPLLQTAAVGPRQSKRAAVQ